MIHDVFHLKQVVIVCIGRKITSRKGLHVASLLHGIDVTYLKPLKFNEKILQQNATWSVDSGRQKAR
jgi:hypothetical protein